MIIARWISFAILLFINTYASFHNEIEGLEVHVCNDRICSGFVKNDFDIQRWRPFDKHYGFAMFLLDNNGYGLRIPRGYNGIFKPDPYGKHNHYQERIFNLIKSDSRAQHWFSFNPRKLLDDLCIFPTEGRYIGFLFSYNCPSKMALLFSPTFYFEISNGDLAGFQLVDVADLTLNLSIRLVVEKILIYHEYKKIFEQ